MRYRAILFLLQKAGAFVARMSSARLFAVGSALGMFWHNVLRIRRDVVYANLQLVFPENRSVHRHIAAAFFRHFCASVLEFIAIPFRGIPVNELSVHGAAHFETALAKRNGVIAVTAHMGNFDMLACSQALAGIPLGIVSKRLHASALNEFWMHTRRACGVKIFEEGNSSTGVVRWLRRRNVLGLVVDQRTSSSKGGVAVPFFGYNVWTSCAAADLALRTGAALVPVVTIRTSENRHRIMFEAEIPIRDSRGELRTRMEIMQELHRVVESWIRTYPEQWMWLHRRFRHAAGAGKLPY
ncbi:MAG: lysophospholipid acyltransferase family protein [Deltaproteobacteria bacterium]|nr:lysophospholipid acyltransferase family protein [Deltaproteobacteria bacterium]